MISQYTIAFYNVENLFDAEHNDYTLDLDYTPQGELEWNEDRYQRKINNLSKVISKIGFAQNGLPPIFLGLAEVENSTCLEDLVKEEKLAAYNYDFVHYDSPDERGVDVAFLYQKEHFELTYSDTYTLYLSDKENNRDYTRDILLVAGQLFGEAVYIIVNHWPSRISSEKPSDEKRVAAAKKVKEIIAEIHKESKNPKIVILGDFNDTPKDRSIKNYLMTEDLFNPMLDLQLQKKGSTKHRGKWYLFDQIILSKNFLSSKNNKFLKAHIFDDFFLQEKSGKRKGAPKRTYLGKWHQGGFSDHFPVFASFQK